MYIYIEKLTLTLFELLSDFSYNQITSIPGEMGLLNTRQIFIVQLSHNLIKSIPDSFARLTAFQMYVYEFHNIYKRNLLTRLIP